MNAANFVEKARTLHGSKYNYSKVQYEGAQTKVTIICPEHGEFQQTPSHHVNMGCGCQYCGGCKKKTLAEFLQKAEKVHGAMFSRYDYSKVVTEGDTKTKIEIICKLHGSFQMTKNKHLLGRGCKKCKSKFSLAAIAWLEYIARTRGIHIKHALRGGEERLVLHGAVHYVDGFCSENNTVYQFHGDFYHGNPEMFSADDVNTKTGKTFGQLYQETKRVEELVVSQGYELEIIWEKDWKSMCQELGLNPTAACRNPDYECPTAREREVANRKRKLQKHKQRLESDAEYKENHRVKVAAKKDKNSEYQARYYAENREKILVRQAKFRAENKDKEYKRVARYRSENRSKIREISNRYRKRNRDKILKYKAKYRAENRRKLFETTHSIE